MRWILADPSNAAEQQWKQHVAAASQRWWQAFQANAPNISATFTQPGNFDIVRFMDDNLHAIDSRLCWEYGPARLPKNVHLRGHRLVITPEAEHWLRPMLNQVLSAAPQIPGWEFYSHRLPEDVAHARAAVQGRCSVEFSQGMIEARIGKNRKIDVLFTFPQENWSEDQARSVAFVLTETLLGEETLDGWIGAIDAVDAKEPGHRWLPLERAADTVSAVARSMLDQLSPNPIFRVDKNNSKWSSYKLQPDLGGEDFPERSDLIVGTSCYVDLIEAVMSGRLFDSRCFSRHKEYFCYLKIDADEIDSSQRVEHRAGLEDPLDDALQQAGVGGTIGGGSGARYSYVDLSLGNVMQALPIIRQVLSQQRAPLRTWLLFFDSQLSEEWFGVYPQTPPPPRFAEAS
ncbi:hypothetical protein [Anatilimnocola floriformis]|uniref:hypothetical protein n=1 Tax=Anatilimnocola floriformis TaxID=2948575 RepID=UPI0020C2B25E|nr:hypothetical protein [Anatilimnocola floriformis]